MQILPQLIEFQKKHLKANAEEMVISVPTCFHTQYTAGNLHTNDDMSPPEPPESILVLEDLRPMGYRVRDLFLTRIVQNGNKQKIKFGSRLPVCSFQKRAHIGGS